jgi:succinyl-diaminopimelate desuccinylase
MQEITDLIKDLIRIPSVHSKPEEIIRCSEFIESYLSGLKIRYQRLNHQGTPSILVVPKSGKVPILLMSHFDVVEADDELFHPYEQNGSLYGRGGLDDKYAVALSLVLLKNHVLHNRSRGMDQDDLPFGILMTGDEEVGGANGANHVLLSIQTEFCIALDGGGVDEIVTKEKGILQMKHICRGKTSHGARPWLGVNAIEMLIRDHYSLKSFFNDSEPDNWHRTMNLSKINAGNSYNKVPDYAEAILDIRYTENDDMDDLVKRMQESITGELVMIRKEPLFVATPSPYLKLLIELNPEIRTAAEHGSSDARYLSKYGMNGIVWGADGGLSHHSTNEHVQIQSVLRLYSRIDQFVSQSREISRD